ncbi:MAG: CHAD domain-containing protein [Arenimonas sp.]
MLQTPGDSLKSYALNQLQRAIACLTWRGSRAHAGVHQARKSMRRARACLAMGESDLGAGAKMIDRELSKICESLSSLRDAQARVESLDRLIADRSNDVESESRSCLMAAKRLAMLARADAMRKEQAIDPNFLTRSERLRMLEAALPVLPWQHLGSAILTAAIHKTLQACDTAAEKALSSGKEHDWHRLRRRRRRLAQQYTALEHSGIQLLGIGELDRKLGNLLGEAQDILVLGEFFKNHRGLSIENSLMLRRFLKLQFKHLSSEAMATR